jgi:hypothetical protein
MGLPHAWQCGLRRPGVMSNSSLGFAGCVEDYAHRRRRDGEDGGERSGISSGRDDKLVRASDHNKLSGDRGRGGCQLTFPPVSRVRWSLGRSIRIISCLCSCSKPLWSTLQATGIVRRVENGYLLGDFPNGHNEQNKRLHGSRRGGPE